MLHAFCDLECISYVAFGRCGLHRDRRGVCDQDIDTPFYNEFARVLGIMAQTFGITNYTPFLVFGGVSLPSVVYSRVFALQVGWGGVGRTGSSRVLVCVDPMRFGTNRPPVHISAAVVIFPNVVCFR